MTSDDELRAKLTKALAENGVVPGSNDMHSWRCNEPDMFPDYCHCIPDLTDDLVAVVREALADAWDAGADTALDHAIRNEDGITLRLDKPNPWREDQP